MLRVWPIPFTPFDTDKQLVLKDRALSFFWNLDKLSELGVVNSHVVYNTTENKVARRWLPHYDVNFDCLQSVVEKVSVPNLNTFFCNFLWKVKPHAIYRFNGVYHIIMFATLKKSTWKFWETLSRFLIFAYDWNTGEKKKDFTRIWLSIRNEKEKCLEKISSFLLAVLYTLHIDGLKYKCTNFMLNKPK